MPTPAGVLKWARNDVNGFRQKYLDSREIGYHILGDEIREIADDGRNDWMEILNRDGEAVGWKVNGEAVQRSKLRVETRKWILSKMLPKIYGPKLPPLPEDHKGDIHIHGGLPDD